MSKWTDFFNPLLTIARELTTLRELYEADLSSRTPPVIRITEKPNRKDTEVMYDEEDKPKGKLRELIEEWNEETDEPD